jgi:uncharacterized protein (TIRG00374 family)
MTHARHSSPDVSRRSGRHAASERARNEENEGIEASPPGWIHWITKISVVLGLGALIATVVIVGPHTILGHLKQIGPWFIVLIAIDLVAAFCDAAAIYLMTRGKGAPPWRRVLVALLAGRAVNTVTPGGNLGEALKISLLSRHCSTQRVIAAIMFVTLTGFTVALAFVAAGTGLTAALFDIPRAAVIVLSISGAIAGVVAIGLWWLLRHGMLSRVAGLAARLHVISRGRRERWQKRLEDLDARLRGDIGGQHRTGATLMILTSQIIQKLGAWLTIVAAGYHLGAGQLVAIMSAGVLINWISTVVPMGLGIHEGGNVALFSIIGAPVTLGVALALARRVNQVVFASIGFIVLSVDKLASHVHVRITARRPSQQLPVLP